MYLFKSYGIIGSSVPWKSISDIGVFGILLKPNKGEPETGAIVASTSLKSEAVDEEISIRRHVFKVKQQI